MKIAGAIILIFGTIALSWTLAAGIVIVVWHILDDRVDIAVPDDAQTVVLNDPNPPMMAWRPRIPDSVGTMPFMPGTLACEVQPSGITIATTTGCITTGR